MKFLSALFFINFHPKHRPNQASVDGDTILSEATVSRKGFNRLDFDEIKRVGSLVGFDIAACARTKKSCGPGCDWLVQDKRYFTLKLIQYIEALIKDSEQALPDEVLLWHGSAKLAAQEYAAMEKALHPVLSRKKKQS